MEKINEKRSLTGNKYKSNRKKGKYFYKINKF